MSRVLGGAQSSLLQSGFNAQQGGAVDLSGLAGGIGAGIFGIIGGLAAASQNKAIADAAKMSMERVNLFITNLRVNRILAIAQLAYDGQKALGNLTNAVSPRGISKQEALMNQVNDPLTFATWSEYESQRREENAAHNMKVDISNRAEAQSQNVVAATAKSAAGGFSIAMEAYTAWNNNKNADEINGIQQGQFSSRDAGWRVDLKGLEAAVRGSGIAFQTAEDIAGLAGGLHSIQQELGRLQTAKTRVYTRLHQEQGRFFSDAISRSSIGSLSGAAVPANLFDLTLDLSPR